MKLATLIRFSIFLIISLLSIPFSLAQGEEILSLNGTWKFHTFLGEGSNYLDIKAGKEDIIFDNAQTAFIRTSGKWAIKKKAERESSSWGNNYHHHYNKDYGDSSYFRFLPQVPKDGYYEFFCFYPWSHTMAVHFRVKHADGLDTTELSQRNRTSKWLSLGVFRIEKGAEVYVEIASPYTGGMAADAIMLRPVKQEDMVQSRQKLQQAFQPSYDDNNWLSLKVPGHWGMINAYANYTGKGWYRKNFELPENWSTQGKNRYRIRFEGVYHVAKVYLNGRYLGRHQGGFTPFEFDVTDLLNSAGSNLLAVEADNNYLVGATWNWGGIIREVKLIRNEDARISFQHIHAEPDLEAGTAKYDIEVRVENNSEQERTFQLVSTITKDEIQVQARGEIKVNPQSIGKVKLSGKLTPDQVKLWHFDRPELYELNTALLEKGDRIHTRKDRFGIRKFEANSSQMFLNGEAVRLVGFNRISDHRYWGSSEPQQLLELDVELMKTAGANFMRIMHGTQNKRLLNLCDEKGILLFEEVNVRELENGELTPPHYPRAKQWLKEMIERDINHPSIVGWSVGNELKDHYEYVKRTYEYVKKLDPSRMALHVSNIGHRKGESPENNPLGFGDMIFQNIYHPNPPSVMDTIRARWPEKAIFLSEFGAQRFTSPDLDHDLPNLKTWYDYFRFQRPFITGASIWSFNDYKSGYNYTLPSENRAWGMVNAWRSKRRSFYTHQRENSPLKELRISDINLKEKRAIIHTSIRKIGDFPNYSLTNYSIRYTFRNLEGNTLSSNEIQLPFLKPGDSTIEQNIYWEKLGEKPYELTVELISSNGYSRHVVRTYFHLPAKPVIRSVRASDTKVRVHFDKAYGSFEHHLVYQLNGKTYKSPKTIAPYIELDSLDTQAIKKLRLVASNGKGESKPSGKARLTISREKLPPIIWNAFIADHKLIVGFSGEWEDESYTLKFGSHPELLDQESTTHARGMMVVGLGEEEEIYFQIGRTTKSGQSQWSPITKAKNNQFRIYE